MRWTPRGFGGERRPPERVRQEGWREQSSARSVGRRSASELAGARVHPPSRREALRQETKSTGGNPWISGPPKWSRSASSTPRR